jgi:hypothetical protein
MLAVAVSLMKGMSLPLIHKIYIRTVSSCQRYVLPVSFPVEGSNKLIGKETGKTHLCELV